MHQNRVLTTPKNTKKFTICSISIVKSRVYHRCAFILKMKSRYLCICMSYHFVYTWSRVKSLGLGLETQSLGLDKKVLFTSLPKGTIWSPVPDCDVYKNSPIPSMYNNNSIFAGGFWDHNFVYVWVQYGARIYRVAQKKVSHYRESSLNRIKNRQPG